MSCIPLQPIAKMEMTSQIDKGLFYRILKNIPVPVLLIDQQFNCLYANKLFLNFFELNLQQVDGTGWAAYLQIEKKKSLFELLAQLRAQQISGKSGSARISTKTGIPVILTFTSELDEKQEWFYFLTFCSEENRPDGFQILKPEAGMTSLTPVINQPIAIELTPGASFEKNNDQDEYIAELKASNRLKDKILAIISHDMNAPIASLKGLTSAFLDEGLTEKERIFLRTSLLKQLDSVSDLTENLLRWATNSFTNNNAGCAEPLDLLKMIKRSVQLILHQASLKRIDFKYDIPAHIQVCADSEQFQIVIRNIITNAIKYTPPGGKIYISAEVCDQVVQIRVKDTGIGISEAKLSKLFTYTQSNTYGTEGEKGIGLGLMLCKEYVEANGGQITVSSDGQSGTTVMVQLPAA